MSALSSCLGLMEKEEEPELFGDSELLSLRCEIFRFNGVTARLRSLTARRGLSERSSGWFWSILWTDGLTDSPVTVLLSQRFGLD